MEKLLNKNTLNILTQAIGKESIPYLNKSKVLFSSVVHLEKGLDPLIIEGNIIINNDETPKLIEDWRVYLMLRCHSRSFLVSGNNFRGEKDMDALHDINFCGFDDLEKYFYTGKEYEKYKNSKVDNELKNMCEFKRNIFILSKHITLEQIMNYRSMHEKFAKKFLLSNTRLKEEIRNLNYQNKELLSKHMKNNQINILDKNLGTMKNCIEYLENNVENSLPILAEVGPSTFNRVLEGKEGDGVLDFLIITVYNGGLSDKFKGKNFPSLNKIKNSGFKLINVSEEIECQRGGSVTFHTLISDKLSL